MSVEHKRPLMAFVIVALICGMVIGHALMSQAVPSLLARPFEVAHGMVFPAADSEVVAGEVFLAAPAAPAVAQMALARAHPAAHSAAHGAAHGKAGQRGEHRGHEGQKAADHTDHSDRSTRSTRSDVRRTTRLAQRLAHAPLRAARHWNLSWRHRN